MWLAGDCVGCVVDVERSGESGWECYGFGDFSYFGCACVSFFWCWLVCECVDSVAVGCGVGVYFVGVAS